MDIHATIPLIASLIYIILLVIVALNRPWQNLHKLFILYVLASILWSLSEFFLTSHWFIDYRLLLFRIVICSSVLWVVQLYRFLMSFLNQSSSFGTRFGYIALFILASLAILGYAPPDIIVERGVFVGPVYGWWFVFYVLPLIVMAVLAVYALLRKFRTRISLEERNKIAYLIVAIVLLMFFGFIGVTPMSIIGGYPMSHVGGLLAACVLAYAIVNHELISISHVLRRGLGWLSLAAVGIGIYLLALFSVHLIFGFALQAGTLISSVFMAVIVACLIYWLHPAFLGKIDQLFYRERYKHRQELFHFIRHGISGISNLQELSSKFLVPLVGSIDCYGSYMLLPDTSTGDFIIKFSEPSEQKNLSLCIRRDSPITEWMSREDSLISRANLDILPQFRGMWEEEIEGIRSLGIELLFPLSNSGKLIGILGLSRKKSGKYSFEDINLVESITSQVAINLEKESLQEELKKRGQELYLINRLTGIITSSLNIQEVYHAFITGLREVIDVDLAWVALIDNDQLHISALYSSNESTLPWRLGDVIPLEGSAIEWVAKNKRSLLEPDLAKDKLFVNSEKYLESGIRSIIYLPLITKNEVIGCLVLASFNPNTYITEQVQLLEQLAYQVSTSVVNAQLYSKTEQRTRIDGLTTLYNRRHFDESLAREVKRHSRYGSMLALVLLDLDNFKSYNDTMGHLAGDELLAEIGDLIRSSIRNVDIPFRYGGDEFALIMPHTSVDDAFLVAERVRVDIAATMMQKGIFISTSIGLASWPSDGLRPHDVINAADNALYHAKRTGGNRTCIVSQLLTSPTKSLRSTLAVEKDTLNTIYALAATIEAKDKYTYGHSRKVRAYAVALAESLNLSSEKVAIISHAALLHDIGKIGIVDGILNKDGTLDNREWDLIRSHPELSQTIVSHVPSLTPCLPAILHHHERWDGSGYPAGLKGEAIPYEARILAIADAFDAMTSLRPYRAPLTIKKAIEELKRGSGSQFDPKLVESFLPIALTLNPEEVSCGNF